MIFDFSKIEPDVHENFRDGQGKISICKGGDGDVCIWRITIPVGGSIGLHAHETNCEVAFCVSGTGKAVYEGVEEPITVGCAHYCPMGHSHTLINTGDEDLVLHAVIPSMK